MSADGAGDCAGMDSAGCVGGAVATFCTVLEPGRMPAEDTVRRSLISEFTAVLERRTVEPLFLWVRRVDDVTGVKGVGGTDGIAVPAGTVCSDCAGVLLRGSVEGDAAGVMSA